MSCFHCGIEDALGAALLGAPLRMVTDAMVKCSKCGEIRHLSTTHLVGATSEYANLPLAQLGIPKLDILGVQGRDSEIWYELTGDLQHFSERLGRASEKAPIAVAR
jgi:hypothetical protein